MASSKAAQINSRRRLGEVLSGRVQLKEFDASDMVLATSALAEGVSGLLALKISESIPSLDRTLRQGLDEGIRDAQLRYLRLQHTTGQILSSFHRASIPVVCMRGVAVAEKLYGSHASLRPISDIDLLLDEREMLNAKQVLWDVGFRPDPRYRNIYARGDVTVDLHHEPLGMERIRMWKYLTPLRSDDFFKFSEEEELVGEKAQIVHPRVLLPYLCFHVLKHSFERLIWLYDIALLCNEIEKKDQWDEVLAAIFEYRLERPCFYALSYAKAYLGASVPDELLEDMRLDMGFFERNLFRRHMNHEVIPFLAERLFARMQPDFRHRLEFWRETIWPRYEVRAQMVQTGCVKCNFIRKRLKQLLKAAWLFVKEGAALARF